MVGLVLGMLGGVVSAQAQGVITGIVTSRLAVEFGGCVASVTTNGLPIGPAVHGSQCSWHPGPAFNGQYSFNVTVTSCSGWTSHYTLLIDVIPAR